LKRTEWRALPTLLRSCSRPSPAAPAGVNVVTFVAVGVGEVAAGISEGGRGVSGGRPKHMICGLARLTSRPRAAQKPVDACLRTYRTGAALLASMRAILRAKFNASNIEHASTVDFWCLIRFSCLADMMRRQYATAAACR